MVTPAAKRDAVAHLQSQHGVIEAEQKRDRSRLLILRLRDQQRAKVKTSQRLFNILCQVRFIYSIFHPTYFRNI